MRARNSDARKGKSGGYRIVYEVKPRMVVLITIYSKSDQADIAPAEIRRIIADFEQTINESSEPDNENEPSA